MTDTSSVTHGWQASFPGPGHDFAIVDAFVDGPFSGNPAGVIVSSGAFPSDAEMQAIAAELNQAETAFLIQRGGATFDLRWFTPTVEVELCGHATLAAAHRIWELANTKTDLAFATRSGELHARRSGASISLDFPTAPPIPAEPWPKLEAILGSRPTRLLTTRVPTSTATNLVAVFARERQVQDLRPDLGALERLPIGAIIVTAPADPKTDAHFVSRCFAPSLGIPEDPATGSAHCALGPLWQPRFGNHMLARQLSRRGALLAVTLGTNRVTLTGRAVTTVTGQIRAS